MGRLVRKPQIPDLDAQIAGLEGVLQSGIGNFTLSYAGTAQILISGLNPGTYTVTAGGSSLRAGGAGRSGAAEPLVAA